MSMRMGKRKRIRKGREGRGGDGREAEEERISGRPTKLLWVSSPLDMKPLSGHDKLPGRFIRTTGLSFPREALIFHVRHPSLPQSHPLAHELGLCGGQNWCHCPPACPGQPASWPASTQLSSYSVPLSLGWGLMSTFIVPSRIPPHLSPAPVCSWIQFGIIDAGQGGRGYALKAELPEPSGSLTSDSTPFFATWMWRWAPPENRP